MTICWLRNGKTRAGRYRTWKGVVSQREAEGKESVTRAEEMLLYFSDSERWWFLQVSIWFGLGLQYSLGEDLKFCHASAMLIKQETVLTWCFNSIKDSFKSHKLRFGYKFHLSTFWVFAFGFDSLSLLHSMKQMHLSIWRHFGFCRVWLQT